jgi:hypothetical protein
MLKKVIYYTCLPQARQDGPFPFEAAGEANTAAVLVSPAHPKRTKMRSFPAGYVEDVDEPRTNLGKCASRRARGWAGVLFAFFSIVLGGQPLIDAW